MDTIFQAHSELSVIVCVSSELSLELKCHVFLILIRSLSSVVSSALVQASPDEPADVSKASLSLKCSAVIYGYMV